MTISAKYTGVRDIFEPGSGNKILKNKLGIKKVNELNEKEFEAYIVAEKSLIKKFSAYHSFTLEDVKLIHKTFLGDIYSWAGELRTVDISKDGFPFAKVKYFPNTIREFEELLSKHTPCLTTDIKEAAYHIAVIHTEILIIHPFREGNG